MLNSWIRLCIRYRLFFIALTLMVSLLALFFLTRLQIIVDVTEMVPLSHPYVQSRSTVLEVFHEKDALIVALTPHDGDIHRSDFIQKIDRITQGIRKLPGVEVSNLLSPTHRQAKVILGNADGIEIRPFKLSLGNPELFDQWLALSPISQKTLISDDRLSVAILARFTPDPKGYSATVDRVESVLQSEQDDTVDVRMSGNVAILAQIERYANRLQIFIPIAILLIALVHFEAFRSWQGMVLPLITAVIALIWVMGLLGALNVPLDVFNSTTPILILAIAAGHAVQILKRYVEEYQHLRETTSLTPEQANTEAVVLALNKVGPLMLAAGGIAALGFYSLMIFEMGSVKTFGLLAGTGILSALFIELTFIPALRSILAPPKDVSLKIHHQGFWLHFMNRLIAIARGRWLLPAMAVLLVVAIVGVSRVEIDNSNRGNFAPWTEVRQQDDFINQHFAGTTLLYVVLDTGTPGGALQTDVLAGVDAIQTDLANVTDVGKTVSVVDYLKRLHQAMHADEQDKYVLPGVPALAAQYLLLYSSSGDAQDLSSFIDEQQQRLLLKVIVKRDDTHYVESLLGRIKLLSAEHIPPSVTVQYGGPSAETAALNQVLARDKLLNIAQIMTAVFVLSGLFFRSMAASFMVCLPLFMSVLGIFGILGWMGIPLNIPTSLISAMAVGIGADYAIYLLARFREEAPKHSNDYDLLYATLHSAGRACLYVASAVAVGYGILTLSLGFYVHQWMGFLISSAMLISVFATLLLVSRLVIYFKPRFIFANAGERYSK